MSKVKPTYGVGYKSETAKGEVFEVIEYKDRKKITIRFSCGTERNTTSTHIKHGKVLFPRVTFNSEVGDVICNKDGVSAEIISIDTKRKRCKLKFEDGEVKNYSLEITRNLNFTKSPTTRVRVGEHYPTSKYGEVEVISYKNAHNVTIKFEDGTESICQAASLRLGSIGHPKSGTPEGFRFTNNEGFSGTVVEYISPLKVKIEWDAGGVTYAMAANVKMGGVYYPNHKSICGIGYFGIGKYKPNKSGNGSNYKQRVYDSWQRMIRRCYDEKEQRKPSCRAYIGVTVCEEWHNFQNFAIWAEDKLDKFEEGWDLDKDMFGDGWLYSPDNCTLLPSKVNWFLSDTYSHKSSGLPDGVTILEPKTPNAKVGYVARCHINNKREYLGFFNTPEEAGEVYRQAKEKEARRIAEEYKNLLTNDQYLKLMSFKLENIHRKSTKPKQKP